MKTILHKCLQITEVIKQDERVAVASLIELVAYAECNVEFSKRVMTPDEIRQYDWWLTGTPPPTMDWVANKPTVNVGSYAEFFTPAVAAMKRLYDWPDTTPEHAARFYKNLRPAIPLITVMEKVISIEEDLHGGIHNASAKELAELKTLHKINSIAMNAVNKICAENRRLTKQINACLQIVGSREQVLEANMCLGERKFNAESEV